MNHRYKIFEVRNLGHDPVPGVPRIIPTTCSIGELLKEEIRKLGGATAFGVESPTLAWLVNAHSHYFIFREDDSDFNIDLAMNMNLHVELPDKMYEKLCRRIQEIKTSHRDGLPVILRKQGHVLAADRPLPHDGMGGVLLHKPSDPGNTVFAAPPLPNLGGNMLPQTAHDLLDIWFRQLTDILTSLKDQGIFGNIAIAFEVGGTIPIPDWFRDWCRDNDIKILEC